MPTLRIRGAAARAPRVSVLGDLLLDVVIAPQRELVAATDVPGRVWLRQGGASVRANTALIVNDAGVAARLAVRLIGATVP